ncbi:hypothetical protein LTR60_003714 [Cryomyces antarcticus]|nr:hypothetical protein LTR60_003714 [Cryomyces antarcticus]
MKQGSEDRGHASPSEFSFSNTSRESMSRQQPPVHLQQSAARARSGTPIRTQSKFREDLPGLPISPPDSRVQSPEVSLPASHAIAIRRGHQHPQRLAVGTTSPATPNPFKDHMTNGRTDSPVSPDGRESVAIMSQSLASVDSEGSWLSGKPVKRSSNQSQLRSSSGSPGKRLDSDASYEELGMPDDVHSHGLTLDRGNRSVTAAAESSNRKVSDISAITPITPDTESDDEQPVHSEPSPDQTVVREGLQRQPTVISRDARIVSGEGLAAEYILGGDYETPPDGTPNDESPFYEEQRARASSVEYGQLAHARHVSAGSAKLLDIPASKSNRHSMGSTYTPSASPGFKLNSSPYFVTEFPVDESTRAT